MELMKITALFFLSAILAAAQTMTFAPQRYTQNIGDPINLKLSPDGGVAPYTYTFVSGHLPNGLLMWPDGTIAGVIDSAGKQASGIQVTDAKGTKSISTLTFTTAAPPVFSRENLHWMFSGRKWIWITRALVVAAELEDWQTTEKCVRIPNGVCSEQNSVLLAAGINPATAQGSRRLLALKITGPILAIAGQELLRRFKRVDDRALITDNLIVAAIQSAIDANNRRETLLLEK